MKRNIAYKMRIYPDKMQREIISKTFGCVRFIYNRMLEDRIRYYEETGLSLLNTPAPYKKEYEWLKEVDSLALANAQMHLNTAFKNFYSNRNTGYPKYKSKKNHHYSYTTNMVNNNIASSYYELIGVVEVATKANKISYDEIGDKSIIEIKKVEKNLEKN